MIQVRLVPPFFGEKMRTEIFFPYIEKIGKYYAVNTFDASTWLAHRELKYCLHRHIKNYCVRLTLKDNGSCVIMPNSLYLLKLKFVGIWSGKSEYISSKRTSIYSILPA